MNIEMSENRILLKRIAFEKKTAGGLILGEIASREEDASAYGQIIAVGKGKHYDYGFVPTIYNVGDIVCYNPRIIVDVNYLGEYYGIMRENDVFFRVPESELEFINIKQFDASEGKEEDFKRATPLMPNRRDSLNLAGKKLY
jgi:co-chaperonin GroES (HSP10)